MEILFDFVNSVNDTNLTLYKLLNLVMKNLHGGHDYNHLFRRLSRWSTTSFETNRTFAGFINAIFYKCEHQIKEFKPQFR
jgi:hypothetical protein